VCLPSLSITPRALRSDLKPDNVLVTEFLSAKVSDFGTSRAKAENDATMTAVGTPLFCAPEVVRGDSYDEKADVYSFGMLLLDMATEEPILDFLGERWRVAFKKTALPKNPMRVIHPMVEDGWRPVTPERPVPGAPPRLGALIMACLDGDPRRRPSAGDCLEALQQRVKAEVEGGAGGCSSGAGGVSGAGGKGAALVGFGRAPPTAVQGLVARTGGNRGSVLGLPQGLRVRAGAGRPSQRASLAEAITGAVAAALNAVAGDGLPPEAEVETAFGDQRSMTTAPDFGDIELRGGAFESGGGGGVTSAVLARLPEEHPTNVSTGPQASPPRPPTAGERGPASAREWQRSRAARGISPYRGFGGKRSVIGPSRAASPPRPRAPRSSSSDAVRNVQEDHTRSAAATAAATVTTTVTATGRSLARAIFSGSSNESSSQSSNRSRRESLDPDLADLGMGDRTERLKIKGSVLVDAGSNPMLADGANARSANV